MKNGSVIFSCANCDAQFTKWTGRCLECGKWGTVVESMAPTIPSLTKRSRGEVSPHSTLHSIPAKTVSLSEIQQQNVSRLQTRIGELDRVLGGGIVPGSLMLLGGEPGIGKSTLALQLATAIPHTVYFSAEESIEQIKLRADRLRVISPQLRLGNESSVEKIITTLLQEKPALAIIDSVQTIYSEEAAGESGSVNQIRACAAKLLGMAKSVNIPVMIVSHVTKEGEITGPKTLEHLVDTVLYLEGDRHHDYRILRAVKNRFGATDEVGIFNMAESGLQEVSNPSAAFIAERADNLPGNILTCLIEGTRPLIVEIQALVNKTVFGYPARKASGFDLNRLYVLIAVLQKRAGLHLEQYDVHINVVGGLQADEPAADLAVAMAIGSAYKDKALGQDLVVFGEVGLGGEVRPVTQTEKRIKECQQLGLKRVITNARQLVKFESQAAPKTKEQKLKIIDVKNIQELITHT